MTDPWPFVPGVHYLEAPASEAPRGRHGHRRGRRPPGGLVEAGQALLRDPADDAGFARARARGRLRELIGRAVGGLSSRSRTGHRSQQGGSFRVISTDAPPIAFHLPDRLDVEGFIEDARVILESGRLSLGPYVERLEGALGPWVGEGSVTAVSNCSDGLIAALWAIRDPGAEVIIPGFTYLATWQAVVWAGMTPVVADVDDAWSARPGRGGGGRRPAHPGHPRRPPRRPSGGPAPGCARWPTGTASPCCSTARTPSARAGPIARSERAATSRSSASVRPSSSACRKAAWSSPTTPSSPAACGASPRRATAWASWMRLAMGMNLRMPELTAAMALRALPMLDGRLAARAAIADRYREAWRDLPAPAARAGDGERSAFKDLLVIRRRSDSTGRPSGTTSRRRVSPRGPTTTRRSRT